MYKEEKIKDAIDCLKEVHDLYDVHMGDWSFVWVAVEALEKQLPKKPAWTERDDKYGYRISEAWCPVCECEVDVDRDNWCSACGQLLDWSEDNESK